MINKFILKILLLLLFSFLLGDANSQSNNRFSYDSMGSAKTPVGLLTYNGAIASKADVDIVKVPSFTYLSIGKIKHTTVVANGCVLVKIAYKSGQAIILEAANEFPQSKGDQPEIWSDHILTNQDCQLKDQMKINASRFSGTMVTKGGVCVHLVNIKKKNVKLFKYMVSSLEMEPNK
ncbi:MAG: hypothetical protein AAFY76_04860 [Cyanobacteria bacterium J06649_11]